jgi:hypothetical protein
MNLNQNLTKEQLKALFFSCYDFIGHHVLWVAKNGDVALTPLPSELTPVGFDQTNPDLLLRYETFVQGNGYVGQQTAEDEKFVDRIFKNLQSEWATVTEKSSQRYVDLL